MNDLKKQCGSPDLEVLILRMAQGDTQALAAFYEETKTSVYAFAVSLLADRHGAEDVMQETYINAYESAGSYRAMGKPLAWLLTITKNLARMRLRTERDRDEELDEALAAPGFEGGVLDRLTLQTALGALSEEERQIVTLHAIAGLKHREIGEWMGLALPTVLSKYRRALSKLKKTWKEEDDEKDEYGAPPKGHR